jgi:hypothetical protein
MTKRIFLTILAVVITINLVYLTLSLVCSKGQAIPHL